MQAPAGRRSSLGERASRSGSPEARQASWSPDAAIGSRSVSPEGHRLSRRGSFATGSVEADDERDGSPKERRSSGGSASPSRRPSEAASHLADPLDAAEHVEAKLDEHVDLLCASLRASLTPTTSRRRRASTLASRTWRVEARPIYDRRWQGRKGVQELPPGTHAHGYSKARAGSLARASSTRAGYGSTPRMKMNEHGRNRIALRPALHASSAAATRSVARDESERQQRVSSAPPTSQRASQRASSASARRKAAVA